MYDQALSALTVLLKPFVKAVGKAASTHVRQLHTERQAGQATLQLPANLMDSILNKTLDRLRGGNTDDTWWLSLLQRVGQQYVAPDFLKQPALQEWLAEEYVADDLKALATAQITTSASNDDGNSCTPIPKLFEPNR